MSVSYVYDFGSPNKVIIDLDRGYLLVSAISVGSSLGVLARKEANLGSLAYEMVDVREPGRRRADPAAHRGAETQRWVVTVDGRPDEPDWSDPRAIPSLLRPYVG